MKTLRSRLLVSMMLAFAYAADASGAEYGSTWAATWATSIQSAYVAPTTPQMATVSAYDPQPDLSFALPEATTRGAENQTFRIIVKPDLWGTTFRIRLSNAFGTKPVTFGAAAVGLQDYQANVVHGTTEHVTFHGGAATVTIPAGKSVFSDPVNLEFIDRIGTEVLAGRSLAISFAVKGSSGPASHHATAWTTNYISPPGSGDRTKAEDDTAFPYSTTSSFFLSEVDVMAPHDTVVVVAYGDSITDGTFSTLNGNDRWANVMSRKLHDAAGGHVSVVNEGISGNAVSGVFAGQSAIDRLDRDVLSLSGVGVVVWLEGINDLGGLATTPDPVIAGYKTVADRLHPRGIAVIGATLPSSLAPGAVPPTNSPLFAFGGPPFVGRYAGFQTDAYRKQLNAFILGSRVFDGTADFSAATTDPATGTLQAPAVPNSEGGAGDYLHPNRYGYQQMGVVAAKAVLKLFQ